VNGLLKPYRSSRSLSRDRRLGQFNAIPLLVPAGVRPHYRLYSVPAVSAWRLFPRRENLAPFKQIFLSHARLPVRFNLTRRSCPFTAIMRSYRLYTGPSQRYRRMCGLRIPGWVCGSALQHDRVAQNGTIQDTWQPQLDRPRYIGRVLKQHA